MISKGSFVMQHLWREAYCAGVEAGVEVLKLLTPGINRASFQTRLIWKAEKHADPGVPYDSLTSISNDGKVGIVHVPVPYSMLAESKRLVPKVLFDFIDFQTGKKKRLFHNRVVNSGVSMSYWSPSSKHAVVTGDSVTWLIDRYGNTLLAIEEADYFQWHYDSQSVLCIITPENWYYGQNPVKLIRYKEARMPTGKESFKMRNLTAQEARHRYGDAYIDAVRARQCYGDKGGLLKVLGTIDGRKAVVNGIGKTRGHHPYGEISKDDRFIDVIFSGSHHHERISHPANAIEFCNWSDDGRYLYGQYFDEDVVGYEWSRDSPHFRQALALEVATGRIRHLFTSPEHFGTLLIR